MAHLVDNKKLIRGALNKIALDFGVHRGTVQRVWKRANVDLDNKLRSCSDVSSRKKGHSGSDLSGPFFWTDSEGLHADPQQQLPDPPSLHAAKLLARGLLPQVLAVDNEVVECGCQQLDESDVSAKFDQLAVEVSEAMEMSEFSSQLEMLIVNNELKEHADVELGELLDLFNLL
ncbi:hypothetical protein H257_09323 [Aphanomyces astaci]|uniref:DUF7769 domain-containing protein n=1 Tax=Aphanomyces astaci TaxID=112090 RepID=W4GB35_APHAT|nr:hypothetical protein H257_09323 [Aphanomyces astaci]ETV76885.1 hypothetical protein H257_09323 [Aphanomyces astaci]|eukprot:XP_009833797.1 hypothetical protein H257_09323 [Aphanomyces astaci]